jgi:hypothetical protein
MQNTRTNYYALLFLVAFAALMGYSIVRAAQSIDHIKPVSPLLIEG